MSRPSPSDQTELARWLEACAARPGELPAGVERVQSRLIRCVGRGELPDSGPAYVKVMAFPRLRDRIRYLFRPMPALHEARMLSHLRVRASDVACPAVLATRGLRRFGSPRLSVLVTAGLPVDADAAPATLAEAAGVAARLAAVGLFHPDLQPLNLPRLTDGRLAVLDLQSARRRRAPLRRSLRLAMAAKLAVGEADLAALAAGGLVAPADLPIVRARAARIRRAELESRVRRCLTNSSEFAVERRLFSVTFRRRALEPATAITTGGVAALTLWIGDRACEVLDGSPPLFAKLVRDPWWLGGRHRLYIPGSTDQETVDRRRLVLLEGHRRWLELRAGRGPGHGAGDGNADVD